MLSLGCSCSIPLSVLQPRPSQAAATGSQSVLGTLVPWCPGALAGHCDFPHEQRHLGAHT